MTTDKGTKRKFKDYRMKKITFTARGKKNRKISFTVKQYKTCAEIRQEERQRTLAEVKKEWEKYHKWEYNVLLEVIDIKFERLIEEWGKRRRVFEKVLEGK